MTHPHLLTGGALQVRSNPFDDPDSHLSLAQVDEVRRLWRKWVIGDANDRDLVRLTYLHKRRVPPIYNTQPKGAA